jgi:hypothetical protein
MRASRNAQHGQALVELVVALIALLPVFLAVGLLAKYQDMQQATVAASRLLAFECSVRISACPAGAPAPELAAEVRERFFGPHATRIVTVSQPADEVTAANGNPFWVDRSGRPLLERFEDVTVEVGRQHFNTPLALAGSLGERSFPGAVKLLSELGGPGRFGLDINGGLVDVRVHAQVARSRPSDGWVRRLWAMPLRLSARTAVLVDGWNASGPYGAEHDSFETRVHAGSRLPGIQPVIDAGYLPVRALLAVAEALGIESTARHFRFHRIDVDLLPRDRIGAFDPAPIPLPLPPYGDTTLPPAP